jgi:hypothetical protein
VPPARMSATTSSLTQGSRIGTQEPSGSHSSPRAAPDSAKRQRQPRGQRGPAPGSVPGRRRARPGWTHAPGRRPRPARRRWRTGTAAGRAPAGSAGRSGAVCRPVVARRSAAVRARQDRWVTSRRPAAGRPPGPWHAPPTRRARARPRWSGPHSQIRPVRMITSCPHHCIPANGPPGSPGTQPVPPGRTELDDPDPDEQSHGEVELRGKRPTTQCGQQQQPQGHGTEHEQDRGSCRESGGRPAVADRGPLVVDGGTGPAGRTWHDHGRAVTHAVPSTIGGDLRPGPGDAARSTCRLSLRAVPS